MHATRFYKLLYYGCRAWQFSDNGFAGTTVGYVEWDHCWIIMQTDARFAVNIAYEKAYTENHGDVGITGNRVNLDTYLGATVELMEYCRTNNCPEDNETEQGFILTQTPTELHIQLDTPPVYSGYYTLYNTTGSSVL